MGSTSTSGTTRGGWTIWPFIPCLPPPHHNQERNGTRLTAPTDKRQLLIDHILAGQDGFYRLAYSYVKDPDAAMDVVQESIAKALGKVDGLRQPAYLKTWFYRILVNESVNYFRHSRRLVPLDQDGPELSAAPEPDYSARIDLHNAIERLGEKERTVIRLRFFEDLKLEEIAKITGANLNTVKSRLYKGLKRLRAWTGEDFYEGSL